MGSGPAEATATTAEAAPRQAELLLQLQRDILEMIATGHSHQATLDALCRLAEAMLPASVASLMLFDADHRALTVRAAPSVPADCVEQLNGLVPGPEGGSCGAAVFTGTPQYTCNTQTDPRWRPLRRFARDFNLCACWSQPVRAKGERVIGSFALSSFQCREPSDFQQRLLQTAASLAGIILNREAEEAQLRHAAHYDLLTDLPNRRLFGLRLEHAIERAARSGARFGLLFIDLDNFKSVNDTQGHDIGDEFLVEVARRMRSIARGSDTLARLGGDEFILLTEPKASQEPMDLVALAERLRARLARPLRLGDRIHRPMASIGISRYPEDGDDHGTLLKHADIALYEAKARGRARFQFYDGTLAERVNQRVNLEAELRTALDQGQFVVHYQPIFRAGATTDRLVPTAVEALLRWRHPSRGLLQPDAFLAVAEQCGIMAPLGRFVTRQVCLDGRRLLDCGITRLMLHLNLSLTELEPGFHARFNAILGETGFAPDRLQLEISEGPLAGHGAEALAEIDALRRAGVTVALDDFGTGYSSLAQLKALPVHTLKIDGSFVANLPHCNDDRVICRTVIAMGHSLGCEVIAEGVETDAQRRLLLELGCDQLQGYLLAEPMALDACMQVLRRYGHEGGAG